MKRTLIVVLAVSLIVAGVAMASVVNSKHDMRSNVTAAGKTISAAGSNTSQVCVFCHHPHRGNSSVVGSTLLWNICDGTQTYMTYSSPTVDSTGITTNGIGDTVNTNDPNAKYSLLCMGCHDGAAAENSFIKATVDGTLGTFPNLSATTVVGNLGATLSDDHPVDFTYPTTAENGVAGLEDIRKTTDGQNVVNATRTYPLFGGTMQCATCHDVHNGDSSYVQFMRGDNVIAGSQICIDCHTAK